MSAGCGRRESAPRPRVRWPPWFCSRWPSRVPRSPRRSRDRTTDRRSRPPTPIAVTWLDTVGMPPIRGRTTTSPSTTRRPDTGSRINLHRYSMPHNAGRGKPIDPTRLQPARRLQSRENDRSAKVPGLDDQEAVRREPAWFRRPKRSLRLTGRRTNPSLLINADTGEARTRSGPRLTSNPSDRREATLIVRPALKNLHEGHRYIVALRNLQPSRTDRLIAPPRVRSASTAITSITKASRARIPPCSLRGDLQDPRDSRTYRAAPSFTSPGTSPSRSEKQPDRAGCCSIRDKAFAELGDHEPRERDRRGSLAYLYDRLGHGLHHRAEQKHRPPGRGDDGGPRAS